MTNPLRAAISQGRCVMAVNLGGVALPAVDMIARAGADCLFVDCERTPIGIESVPALSRAARANGTATAAPVDTTRWTGISRSSRRAMGKTRSADLRSLGATCGSQVTCSPASSSRDWAVSAVAQW